ncbi:MAG: DUF4130 domain-containing protein [Thermoplasmata archaeon]
MTISQKDMKFLKANDNVTQGDIELAKKIDKGDLHTATDENLLRIRHLIREVGRELHSMKGFVRFKHAGKKLKYGYMKPEHEIGSMISGWFANRFPGVVIVLGNKKESWVSIRIDEGVEYVEGGDLKSTVRELAEMLGVEEVKDFEDLWEKYYKSQYAEERKNIELFKKNMPTKYRNRAQNITENRFHERTLDKLD